MESSVQQGTAASGEQQQGSSGTDGAAQQAKEKAQEVGQQAQSTVRDQVDQRSTQVGEQVTGTAESLRTVGEQLRSEGKETPARLADQAAERSERLGGYLQDADADTLLRDVEDFGRRQPWAVALGGLALGLVAARFLKASSSERYQGSSNEAGSPSPQPREIPVPRQEVAPLPPVEPTPTRVPVGHDPSGG
jgi:hypothetical protein